MFGLTFEQQQDIGLKFVLDLLEPVCPYGAKFLKAARFYGSGEKTELELELGNVSAMVAALESSPDKVSAVRHVLSALKDISGSIRNCKSDALTEIELFELTAFLLRVKELIPLAESLIGYDDMTGARFERVDEPLSILDPTGSGRLSFYIEDSRTPELLRLRREKRMLEEKLFLLNSSEELNVDELQISQGEDKDRLLAQRATVAGYEERELLSIYAAMSDLLRPMLTLIERNAEAAGRLDAAISKALLARRYCGTKPDMGVETLLLEDAVNPEIAEALSDDGRSFTPITAELPRGATILTGANMGGKSVAIKTIALNTALALMGFFVFCKTARIPMFDRFELINRDFSSIHSGLSSFGGEILRFNEAVERLREGGLSFIAMDEFARGTNSLEGAAIVRGVIKYLNNKNAVTILATHYDGAAEFASRRYQVRGLKEQFRSSEFGIRNELFSRGEENEYFDRKGPSAKGRGDGVAIIAEHMDYGLAEVEKGAVYARDAVLVCKLLGMDEEILSDIEQEGLRT